MVRHRLSYSSVLGALALAGLWSCSSGGTARPLPTPAGGSGGVSGSGGVPGIPGTAGASGSGGYAVAGSGGAVSTPDAALADGGGSSDAAMRDGAAVDGSSRDGAATDGGSALTLMGDFATMGDRLCFKDGQTKNKGNLSPLLSWMGTPPAGTLSYALSLFDTEGNTTHWIIWDMPVTTSMLPAMLPKGVMPAAPAPMGSIQRGSTFAGTTVNPGYFGPGAPGAARRYEFQLWPLKVAKLQVGATTAVNTIRSTTLPANASGMGVILSVWGNQDAVCQ